MGLFLHTVFAQTGTKNNYGIQPGFVSPSYVAKPGKTNTTTSSLFEKFDIDYKDNNTIYAALKPKEQLDINSTVELFKSTYFSDNANYNLTELKVQSDGFGETHYKYQQTYKDIPIEGNEIIFHGTSNSINSLNGKFAVNIDISTKPFISNIQAIDLAKTSLKKDSITFAWEDTSFLKFANKMQEIETQIDFNPKVQEIITYINNKPLLCFIVNISTSIPFNNYNVYVDANTGKIISFNSTVLDADGTAETYYHGSRPVVTEHTGTAYKLVDNTRKIVTYDMLGGLFNNNNGPKSYYYDGDNNWGQSLYLENFNIQTISDLWAIDGEALFGGNPDLFLKIVDGEGNLILTTEVKNNTYPPILLGLRYNIVLNNPPYTVTIYDEDIINTSLGSFILPTTSGNKTFNLGNGTSGTYQLNLKKNPALDAHWGMEVTYDFYKEQFNRTSYNGNGATIYNYTNIAPYFLGPNNGNWTNNAASHAWNGGSIMLYGFGDSVDGNPYTKLDVIAHEYTHSVIRSIVNLNTNPIEESAAIHEAVADMMAMSIDKNKNSGNANWTMGEGVVINRPYMRSLQDPEAVPIKNDIYASNCYLDDNWQKVQSNVKAYAYVRATVLGYWYYLLCNGGNGTNDFGHNYSVTSIGIDKAQYIVYKTLFWLTSTSNFIDFRNAVRTAVRLEYGATSNEYIQMQNAFYAVNLWDTPGSSGATQCQSITNLTNASGTFEDGSGTSNYQNNIDCKWLIKPSAATYVTLKFNYLNTEAGKDTVVIYNGNTTTSPRIGVYSGTTFPDSIVVNGSQALVVFKTDGANVLQGWSIKYTSTSATTGSCNGLQTYTASSGTVTDGSGSTNYVNNAECSWLITPPGATSVTLNFTAFNTELNYDFVTVYNGNNTYAPVLGTFSGTSLPSSVIASSGEMLVVFTSDGRTTAAGWSANYTSAGSSICSGTTTLTTASGSFSDGSGNNDYQNHLDCNWLIKPTGVSSVTLTFDSLDVEDPPVGLPGIYYDYVNMYDGQDASATLIGTYAGSELPPVITSSGNALFVVFHTDGRTTAKGWNAHYTSGTGQYCSGTTYLTSSTGSFTDGSGSNNYQSNSDCKWLIQPANATSIVLSFSSFNVESGVDGVIVYDGASVNSPILGTFSGSTLPASVTSSSGNMLVRFLTDGQNNFSGFSATYNANISPLGSNYAINGYEYWFDNNSASRTFVSTTHVYAYNLNTGIPVNSLSTGVHTLNIRFLDNQDQWSSVLSSLFYKGLEDNNTINNITGYEYWFDDNYASKTSISVSAQKILNLNSGLNTASLSTGVHVLNIRFKDSGNQWSSVLSSLFYKGLEDNNTVNNITEYEYWFDNNYASKVNTTITPQKILNLNTGLSVSTLQQGVHVFNIRFKDSGKQWSSVLSQIFYKNGSSAVPVNKVSAYRYWYDRSTSNITTVVLPTPVNPYGLLANFDVSALSSGQHTIHFQFKDLIDSWSGVTNDTFNVATPVRANFIANDTTLCYRGTVTFTNQSTGATSYLWQFGDGDSSVLTNPTHTYNTPGFYTVSLIAVSNQGTRDTLKKINYISVTIPNVGVSPNVTICNGTSTSLTATGAVSYVWSPASGLNTTTGSTVAASPSTNTTYRVIGTDQYGCLDTAFVTVNVSNVLQVGLTASQTTICQGDTVTLNAIGANTYSWNPTTGLISTTGSTVKAVPLSTITYNVIGTSSCGSDTESIVITVKPKPTTFAGRDTAVCSGKSVVLNASGASSYVWNNGVATSLNTVTPVTTTTYIVTGMTNGCSKKDTVLVTVNPLPIVQLPDVSICPTGNYTFNAGNPGATYLWQNNSTAQTYNATAAGIYWVQVTNNYGCVTRDTGIVNMSNIVSINLRDTAICAGQTVILNAENPGATYTWNTGAHTQTILVNQTSVYSVIVTAAGGCSGTDTSNVVVRALPIVSLNLTQDTVTSNTSPFVLSGGIPTGGVYSGSGVVSGIFNPAIAGAGTHVITYTYTDNNGCSNIAKDTIIVQIITGIKNNSNSIGMNIYPNPTNGMIKFTINNSTNNKQGVIQIIDAIGQVVYSDDVIIVNSSSYSFDLSNLSSGIYYFKLIVDNNLKVLPFELVK